MSRASPATYAAGQESARILTTGAVASTPMPLRSLVKINLKKGLRVPSSFWRVFNLVYTLAVWFFGRPRDSRVRFHSESLHPERINVIREREVAFIGWVNAVAGETPVALHVTWAGLVHHVHVETFQALSPVGLAGAPSDSAGFLVEFDASVLLKILGLEVEYDSGRRHFIGFLWIYVPWSARDRPRSPSSSPLTYAQWTKSFDRDDPDAARRELDTVGIRRKISLIMAVREGDESAVWRTVQSVAAQWYPDWELHLVVDSGAASRVERAMARLPGSDVRFKVAIREDATDFAAAMNSALTHAAGTLIALVRCGDSLASGALWEVAKAWIECDPELLYADEDTEISGTFVDPYFKPAYSPDELLAHNYFGHFLVTRTELLRSVGGFGEGPSVRSTHDIALRLSERTGRIAHLPRVLCHAAPPAGSSGQALEEDLRTVRDAVVRRHIDATVEAGLSGGTVRIRRRILGNPRISIVIPFRDRWEMTHRCVRSILDRSTYGHYEVVLISNDSEEPATRPAVASLVASDPRVRAIEMNIPFNYSRLNNQAAAQVQGTHLLLLNNDTEVLTPEWMEALLEHSQRLEVGVVGGKLLYEGGTVQHTGVVVGIRGAAAHGQQGRQGSDPGYFSRMAIIRNVSAVTGACMMIKRALFLDVGGLDEEGLPVSLNDIDLGLRLGARGLLNVYTPYCELIHHESVTRGKDYSDRGHQRAWRERATFIEHHREVLERGDPYYNPNLNLVRDDYSLGSPSAKSRRVRMAPNNIFNA